MLLGFGALDGALAASNMSASGNSLIRNYQVTDPANDIADELARAMRRTHGLTVQPMTTPVTAFKPEDIAAALPSGTRYALDVQTTGWNVSYFRLTGPTTASRISLSRA